MKAQAISNESKQTWETPPQLFNYLDKEFDFTLDPCCTPRTAKCDKYYTPQEDGLKQSWDGERVFCNPPYSDLESWTRKSVEEARNGAEVVVMLIPMWSDRAYWHNYVMQADELWMIEGRVRFLLEDGERKNPTYPSVVVVFRHMDYDYPYIKQVRDWKNKKLDDI